jgi:hypothetical protein
MATQSSVNWWGRKVSIPSCRACGYAVKGLPSFICPECGSDLREVGIDTPGAGRELLLRLGAGAVAAAYEVRDFIASAVRVLREYALALGRLMWLRAPVKSQAVTITVRSDGRVVIDPPLQLPDGRHDAVIVISHWPD